jgi:Carboxypeptidase regulatory-like domain
VRTWEFFCALLLFGGNASGEVLVTGRVIDDRGSPVRDVQLSATSESEPRPVTASTDPTGSFRLQFEQPGPYVLNASKQGYFEIKDYRLALTESTTEIVLTMNPLREVFQSLNVNGTPSPVSLDRSGSEAHLSGTNVNDVPFPSTNNLRNSLRLMPVVVQDQYGRLHFQGGTESQTNYLLEGFRVSDPIDGTFSTRIGIEGIQTVGFLGGNFSPEYGYGSAGVLQVHTDPGSSTFRYSATNFVPGIDTQYKLHVGDWTPRAAFSGPLIHNRAWFSDNWDGIYDQTYVPALPKDQNFSHGWSTSNLLHTQWNLTPSNLLFADFLINFNNVEYLGLAPLNPQSTTQNQRYRQWLFGVKDQQYFARGFLIEFGFAQQNVYRRMTPQGDEPYIATPSGYRGNYFVNSKQTAVRDEFLTKAYLPVFHFIGTHEIRAGIDAFHTRYDGLFHRTSFEHLGFDGNLVSATTFAGSGGFSLSSFDFSSYGLDEWKPHDRVLISLGLRQDWNDLIHQNAWSPRVSVSYAPFSSRRTRLFGGFALTVDATNLLQFSQPLDQLSILTRYMSGQPVGLPLVQAYTIPPGGLKAPTYSNWTAGLNHDFGHHVSLAVTYLRKRGDHGLTYASSPVSDPALNAYVDQTIGMPAALSIYSLTNLRSDRYHSLEFTVRQAFAGQYEWMASYVRSSAVSTAVINQSIDQPFNVSLNSGPLPWDAPNHFLSWAYFPLPWKKWSISYLIDARSGFPFSVQDVQGNIVGTPNSFRFPMNFDLNLHVERRFEFRGHRFAIRVGVNNITDHQNPTGVYNTVGSPQFMQFIGDEGRHVVLRLRFFGNKQ